MKVVIKGISAKVSVNVDVEVGLEEIGLDIEKDDYTGLTELAKVERATQESRDKNRNVREFFDNGGLTSEIKEVIGHEIARQIKESFEN